MARSPYFSDDSLMDDRSFLYSTSHTMVDNNFYVESPCDEAVMDLCSINTMDLLPLPSHNEVILDVKYTQRSESSIHLWNLLSKILVFQGVRSIVGETLLLNGEIEGDDPEQFVNIVEGNQNNQGTRYPDHWFKYPDLEKVPSEYDFNVLFHRGDSQNWLYSAALEKVYIKIHSVMNVSVSYKPINHMSLFLRAMIVFSSPDDMHLEVNRCHNHVILTDKNRDVPESHILKSYHPKTQYFGDKTKQLFGERLSLVIPLEMTKIDEYGVCNESVGLEFVCQSSCATGINRKPAAIVFSLENPNCEILGKRVINFKVCSCPKRDMAKESENIMPKKRDASEEAKGKRPNKLMKRESTDCDVKIEPPASVSPVSNNVQTQPTETQSDARLSVMLTMPDRDSMNHVLRSALNECTSKMANFIGHPNPYVKYVNRIKLQMGELSDDS